MERVHAEGQPMSIGLLLWKQRTRTALSSSSCACSWSLAGKSGGSTSLNPEGKRRNQEKPVSAGEKQPISWAGARRLLLRAQARGQAHH